MTDWGTTYEGPFVDNVKIMAGATTVFADDAEAGDAKWVYADPWVRSDGTLAFTHNYYLQWRNTNANGGYDSALGDSRWRFGPANTGLLVWYNNNSKTDNEVFNYLNEYPGYGPKGRMLVVDSHPEPYREPANGGEGLQQRRRQRRVSLANARCAVHPAAYGGLHLHDSLRLPIHHDAFTNHFNGRPAVSTFNDALGYYPGAENVPGGPVGQTTPRWMTKQWDASVVVPSKSSMASRRRATRTAHACAFDCSFDCT